MGWSRFFRRSRWDDERALELESHIEIETDENLSRGMTPDEARYAAQRKLGNTLLIREEIFRMNSVGWLDSLYQDLRFGVRLLFRSPGFTVVALLSLTLGIGANAAVFQLVDAVRLRSLPVPHPEQLVEVRIAAPRSRSGNFFSRYAELSNPLWEQLRAHQEGLSGVVAWAPQTIDLSASGEVRRAEGLVVSGNFFEVLGVPASRGRVLTDADDRRGCAAGPAVISHAFWEREYGGDPTVLGRKLRLDNHMFTIVGITPPAFLGIEVGRSYDVAIPVCAAATLSPDAGLADRSYVWWLSALGRLRPGWTVERVTARLRAVSPALFRETLSDWFDPKQASQYLSSTLEARPSAGGFSQLRAEYTTPLWFLFGLSGLVLLASCVNLANLMLARAETRELEIGVRLATGASRLRVVRQLFTESLLLAVIGTAGGLLLARWLNTILVAALSTEREQFVVALPTDLRLVSLAIGMVVLTATLFGLTPALRATSRPIHRMMKSGGRSAPSASAKPRLQGALVTVQVMLSMTMVGCAALLALSLHNLSTVDTGHRLDGLIVADLAISPMGTPDDRVPALVDGLLERLRSTPGIESVAQTAIPPMRGYSMTDEVRVDRAGASVDVITNFHHIGPGYFRTVGVPLLAGRDFDDRDRVGSRRVAIVNRTFAVKALGTTSPLGRVISIQTGTHVSAPHEIVGLVEDAMYRDIREPVPPVVHLAIAQDPDVDRGPVLMIRSSLPPSAVKPAVLRAVADAGGIVGVQFSSLMDYVRTATQRDRMLAGLSGGFAVLALALSGIGIYGVLSYLVARRRQEIGVRLALGASPGAIVAMVARRSLGWLAVGLAGGTLLAVCCRDDGAFAAVLAWHRQTPVALAAAAVCPRCHRWPSATFVPARPRREPVADAGSAGGMKVNLTTELTKHTKWSLGGWCSRLLHFVAGVTVRFENDPSDPFPTQRATPPLFAAPRSSTTRLGFGALFTNTSTLPFATTMRAWNHAFGSGAGWIAFSNWPVFSARSFCQV